MVRSFDPKAGFVEPKSRAGVRRVPIASVLRELLIEHHLLTDRRHGLGHLFPGSEAEAAGMLDAYLARADTSGRLAQLSAPDATA